MVTNRIDDVFTVYGTLERVFGDATKNGNEITYKNDDIELKSVINEHSSGIFERIDTIKNVSEREITLTSALSKFTLNGGEYQVYTQTSKHIHESLGMWQPLSSGIFGSSDEIRTNQDVNPFVAVFNEQTGRGYAFHLMSESMFEYKVHRHCEFLDQKVVCVEMGIKSENFAYVLAPNEEIELPRILYYEFKSRLDLDAYKLHRYFNEKQPSKIPVIYNSWMCQFDFVDFDLLVAQLEKAKKLGCEYFVVDAGWFGETKFWWLTIGDWNETEKSALAGRMSELADKVREAGLKFGLWFEIERAGLDSQNQRNHPEFYIKDGEFYYVDFSNPDACDFIYNEVKRNIDKYGIEFIKFDLNGPLRFDKSRHAFLDYYKGYEGFISRIRKEYPSIHLECCASGGGRMSLSNVKFFDSFWMSDNHGIYAQLEIFKNTLKRMPSRMLERWATIRSLENFTPTYPVGEKIEKILLSADANWGRVEEATLDFIKDALVGGPLGISCDLSQVSDDTLSSLAKFIKEYKSEESFWANTESHILCDTETVTVLQFNDRKYEKIKIYAYAKHPNQEYVTVYPFMENLDGEYLVKIKNDEEVSIKAAEIDKSGIDLRLNLLNSANHVILAKK